MQRDRGSLPRVALTVGDPAGIGPELALRALGSEELREALRLVVIGPASLRPGDVEDGAWIEVEGPASYELGRPQESCGRAALAALRRGHELALERKVDALVTGPVSKEALHLAGERVEGQTELLMRWSGTTRAEMVAIAGPLRIMLLTRHMPLCEAIAAVRAERVLERLRLFDAALRELAFATPRIAVCGLNPHAGEGGLLGGEELEHVAPAVRAAREEGLAVSGPVSPDSVFVEAATGRYDGVLALYHDQAFIAAKLYGSLSGGRPAVTWIAGLPYLRLSPAHGTAFDIAGRGIADPRGLFEALRSAAELAGRLGVGSGG